MGVTLEANLSAYNRQVLQWQEDAYTLAYYLLGSRETACQVVEQTILQLYNESRQAPGRLKFLRRVLACCKAFWTSIHPGSQADPILALPLDERQAVLLVDVLGLSYTEAAQVIGTSTARVSQQLVEGRLMAARML